MRKTSIIIACIQASILLTNCSKNLNDEIGFTQNQSSVESNELTGTGNISFANGQGALLLPHLNGEVQHFSFHVVKDANGEVQGTWESKSPGQDLRTHGILNCLTFLDDHTAYMTGVITQKIGAGYPGE